MNTSNVKKRSIVVAGHKTSVSLESPFFDELKRMAKRQNRHMGDIVAELDSKRTTGTNLSSAIRLAVLADLQSRAAA